MIPCCQLALKNAHDQGRKYLLVIPLEPPRGFPPPGSEKLLDEKKHLITDRRWENDRSSIGGRQSPVVRFTEKYFFFLLVLLSRAS